MNKKYLLESNSPEETYNYGQKLAELLTGGEIIALVGELGSGKTVFVKGLAAGLGVEEQVISPSFVLVREYRARFPLYHLDFYRINNIREIINIGFEEYLNKEKAVVVIEWADKVDSLLPKERLAINFIMDIEIENKRELIFQPSGSQYLDLVSKLMAICEPKKC